MLHNLFHIMLHKSGSNRRSIGILSVLAGLFTVIVLNSFQLTTTDTQIQNAQTWFQNQYTAPKFFDTPVTPLWASARKVVRNNGVICYEVPLAEGLPSYMGDLDLQSADAAQPQHANGYVHLYIEETAGSYAALMLRVVGTKTYVQNNGTNATQNVRFDLIPANFSGVMEYFTMNSNPYKGLIFQNGVPVARTATIVPGFTSEIQDRCTTTNIMIIYYTISHGNGGNTSFTVNGMQQFTSFSPDCFEAYTPFLPDGYANGLNSAFYGNFNGGQNNNEGNPNQAPNNSCCTMLADQQDLETYMALPGSCLTATAFIENIQCETPSLSGYVGVESCNTGLVGIPTNWSISSSNCTIKSLRQHNAGCGWSVNVKAYAQVQITLGINPVALNIPWVVDHEIAWVLH